MSRPKHVYKLLHNLMFKLNFEIPTVQRAHARVEKKKPDVYTIEFGRYSVKGSKTDVYYTVEITHDEFGVDVDCNCVTYDGFACYHGVAAGLQYIKEGLEIYEREQEIENA